MRVTTALDRPLKYTIEVDTGIATVTLDEKRAGVFRLGPRTKQLQVRLPGWKHWLPARGHIEHLPAQVLTHLNIVLTTRGHA